MNQERENCILIDWFAMSFRDPCMTVKQIQKMLGLPDSAQWIERAGGRYFYRNCVSFNHISIYYNNANKDDDYPLLEMSGQGCREFESYSTLGFDFLFSLAKDSKKYHMARLDVSYDDFTGVFNLPKMVDDYYKRNWVSNSTKGRITVDIKREVNGFSVMTGVKSSDIYMRVYDKAVERGFYDGRHWVRLELVLKHDRGTAFIKNPAPIGQKFRGVLAGYFRFVTPNKKDTNKRRWSTRPYWADFLGAVDPISTFTPKNIEYNFSRLHKYVFKQAGNCIDTYLRCVGLFDFLDELIKRDTKGLTEKQKFVIRQCQDKYKNGEQITTEFIENLKKGYETLKTASGSADQSGDGAAAAASEPQLVPSESSNVGQLPDEADPFADVPLPEPPPLPSDWYDDS